MKKIKLLSVLFMLGIAATSSFGANIPLEEILFRKAKENLGQLSKESIPAYYISYRVYETTDANASSTFGELITKTHQKRRILQTIVRVGSPKLDNTHEIKQNNGGEGSVTFGTAEIPYENDESTLALILWEKTDQVYKAAVQRFQKVKANMAVVVAAEDKSPDFTSEKSEIYSVDPISDKEFLKEQDLMIERIKKFSAKFRENKELDSGNASYQASLTRSYFASTEGTKIAQNSLQYRIGLNASTIADDGMNLPLYNNFFAHSFKELPSDKEVEKEVLAISKMLSDLRRAPIVDTYAGPALLSPEASGVFFHEFFGHRIEAARMKQESDAQTFKKKIGELVLSSDMSVVFDPTIRYYKQLPLSGDYVFDDEGIRGRRVDIVKDGRLKTFLASRTPIEEVLQSNGHGRGVIYLAPVTRQSNMIIESNSPKTEKELRQLLIDELKRQDKPFGYLFSKVSGGFTNTNRVSANSFNVNPLIVYRVFADGKPDQLVRGVNMIGTPLSMFSQIGACGKELDVFNGYCGAESGSIPVSCVAPAIFVKMIETQRQAKSHVQPPILPRP